MPMCGSRHPTRLRDALSGSRRSCCCASTVRLPLSAGARSRINLPWQAVQGECPLLLLIENGDGDGTTCNMFFLTVPDPDPQGYRGLFF